MSADTCIRQSHLALPEPRNWLRCIHNDYPELPAVELRQQIETLFAQHQKDPRIQEWLDEMLEWCFGYPDALLTLIELGAQTKSYHLGQLFNDSSHFPDTATDEECVKLVEAFLDHGADPNAMTANGGLSNDTPALAWAMVRPKRPSQCVAIASLLIERGALVDGPDPDSLSGAMRKHDLPLQYAVQLPTPELIELLISHGAKIERLNEEDWERASDVVKGWRKARDQAKQLEATWATPTFPAARPRF